MKHECMQRCVMNESHNISRVRLEDHQDYEGR